MLLRELNEARELRELASFALKSSSSLGRLHPEEPDKFRPVYLRDRDRVIHSSAFRRLEYKTQVFVNHEGDYYRTRLTHTLEVAQIARSVAYSLSLNEGFVEALSLAHDLGHPPFGHAGEEILNRLMLPYGGFEHNRQGLRIVDHLEKHYPSFDGLNLTYELRESILKNQPLPSEAGLEAFADYPQPFLEAQVVDLSDRVAYTHHDLDDGLQAGILTEEGLQGTRLWRDASAAVNNDDPQCTGRMRLRQVTNRIIKWIIGDMIGTSSRCLKEAALDEAMQARRKATRLIRLSAETEKMCKEMNEYLDRHFYKDYRVMRMVVRSERILNELFQGFTRRPETLPPDFQDWVKRIGLERAVCDYLAGMTDRFAEEEWNRLRF
ncbi:MAG: deoxyguanosinetriphosphate triphosphohydrolase [Planctomycetes bacterium]|nr:deoxyguanosinetriphosphate triphosphohydrolase [Planctomycetota bacterium]